LDIKKKLKNMFVPKKSKFKKQQKGKSFNRVVAPILLNNLKTGSIGLRALQFGRLNSKQMESIYKIINKTIKKTGKLILKVFPQTPISKKPIEIRMGKGKGNIDHWVSKIKSGSLICELEVNSSLIAIKALQLAQLRIPFKTKITYQN